MLGSMWYIVQRGRTFRCWIFSNLVSDFGRTAKVQGQNWSALAVADNIGYVEGVLAELVIGGTDKFVA